MLVNLLIFALVLGIIVLIHELGHLLAAKKFGIYCHEFSIGMGPALFKIKKPGWETTYSIRALPLGGYVAMAGEDMPVEEGVEVPFKRTIDGIEPWKRLIVMLAGIFMNLVLALIIFTGLFSTQGVVDLPEAKVESIIENSPASKSGLEIGDEMKQFIFADGRVMEVNDFNDLMIVLATYEGEAFTVRVERNGELLDIPLQAEYSETEERYLIGIQAPKAVHRELNLIESIGESFKQIKTVVLQFFFIIGSLFRGVGKNAIGGPIGIYEVTSQVRDYGLIFFLNLVALLSVNLAVVNLMPIPVMDGGRALLTIIEMIIGRPIPEKIENAIMSIGLAMIVALFVFIMINDIRKLI